jgi:hypothetical protein
VGDFGATVTEETAARLRPELTRLIAEFRATARVLVGALPNPDLDDDIPDEVEVGGQTWWIHWHDPHYRCPAGFHDIARLLDLVPDLVSKPPQRG